MKNLGQLVDDQTGAMIDSITSPSPGGKCKLDEAEIAFKASIERRESISQALAEAMNVLVPDFSNSNRPSDHSIDSQPLSNSVWDEEDDTPYHIVSQILLQGRSILYLSPDRFKKIDKVYCCHPKLLSQLQELGLIKIVNQVPEPEAWGTEINPETLTLLENATSPRTAADALMQRIYPGFNETRNRLLAEFDKWSDDKLYSTKPTGVKDDHDRVVRALAFRMACLEEAQYDHMDILRYDMSCLPVLFGSHLNYAYRSLFGRPFSSFGADFIWPEKERREFFVSGLPSTIDYASFGKDILPDREIIRLMVDLYRPILGSRTASYDKGAFTGFSQEVTANDFSVFFKALQKDNYWRVLGELRLSLTNLQLELSESNIGNVKEKLKSLEEARSRAGLAAKYSAQMLAVTTGASVAPILLGATDIWAIGAAASIGVGMTGLVWSAVKSDLTNPIKDRVKRIYPRLAVTDKTAHKALASMDEIKELIDRISV